MTSSTGLPVRATTRADIHLEHLSYAYPGAQESALADITLHIAPGDYVALLGHNGSGKSTLSRIIGGLTRPTSGRATVAGMDTAEPAHRARMRQVIGMIFSDPDNQIVATVVEDDVGWGLAARGFAHEVILQRTRAALTAVGLGSAYGLAPSELSGGQRQRLAIAGVLALEPSVLIADEPTAMLDPRSRVEISALLRQLNREHGLTVIHVTHLLEEAAEAHRVVALDGGRVALDATPAIAFADLDRLRALRLVIPDTAQLIERLRAVGIAAPSDALAPDALVRALEQRP
ncbi:MAG TPA: ATP-binding cassette domain-containing protein [Ktedonobacterales bacterium]|nr:ATP-binding cassette domain-containing protein [Ktedonobacterales bacterium]